MRSQQWVVARVVAISAALLALLALALGCRPTETEPLATALVASTATGIPSPSPAPTNTGTPSPSPAPGPAIRAAADVSYCVPAQGADPHLTCLDIYTATARQPLPVLIYVHGGGWSGGDHDIVGAKATYFTHHGFVFVSVNYRLGPQVRPHEQAGDVAMAIAWVKGHAAEYGGDGNQLFLLGHSAGAHLSALVCSDETYLRAQGLGLPAVRGVILLDSAAYDVEALMQGPEAEAGIFRAAFGSDPAYWRRVSPRAHIAPGKGIPPHLLVLATASGQRRPAAEDLAADLRAAGVYAQVADASAFSDHVQVDARLGQAGDPPTAAVQAFLDMLLAGPPDGLGGEEVLQAG